MKPRVYSCIPTRSHAKIEAAHSHYVLQTHPDGCDILPSYGTSSLLCKGFNKHWARALNWQKANVVDYFLMHHDDIEVQTPYFLDVMIQEMRRVEAAVLSVVQPIKDGKQSEYSMAIDGVCPWVPRRMTFDEVAKLPETFTLPRLLINTGLMLVDIRRPEFHEMIGRELYFHFEINDRIIQGPDGMLMEQVRSEDWNFSRLCHSRFLPVYATRKIQCLHYGEYGFSNQPQTNHDGASANGAAESVEHCDQDGEAEAETQAEEVACL